jgi:hypothetical protein
MWFQKTDPAEFEKLSQFRNSLMAASRVYPNPEFEPLIAKATHADLEWLLHRFDETLDEAPRNVKDRAKLAPIQKAVRHYRSVTAQAQHTKKTLRDQHHLERLETRSWITLGIALASLVVAIIALLVKRP